MLLDARRLLRARLIEEITKLYVLARKKSESNDDYQHVNIYGYVHLHTVLVCALSSIFLYIKYVHIDIHLSVSSDSFIFVIYYGAWVHSNVTIN